MSVPPGWTEGEWQQWLTLQAMSQLSCYLSTSSGAMNHGQHWGPFAQAHGHSLGLSNLGAIAQQSANQAQLAYQAQYANIAQSSLAQSCPEPLEDAGISAGEIIGHRAWRRKWYGLLRSMAVDKVWAPNEVMEGTPEDGIGVHAFKTQSEALSTYADDGLVAVGTVALWGTVIEHELGYRAEFGKIKSIDMVCGVGWWRERRLLRRLRQRYGV